MAARLQLYFENYFQIPYPLPKQDMVAVPDFGAGNWFANLCRELTVNQTAFRCHGKLGIGHVSRDLPSCG